MLVHHMCTWYLLKLGEGVRTLRTRFTDSYESALWALRFELVSLEEEQPVALASLVILRQGLTT